MKPIYKRKDKAKDMSIYRLVQLAMSDICALSEEEFLTKYDECVVDAFKVKPKEFDDKVNDWLGVDNWRKHFDGPFPSGPMNLEINGYSNYQELMQEAHYYAEFIAKRAFEMGRGRLHRSASRISILLTITASEDFVNLQCGKNIGLSKRQIGNKSLIEKWKLLLPDLKEELTEFKCYLKIRNNSIIHFKNSDKLELKHIIDLNFENAKKLNKLVLNMMLEYKVKMRDVWDIVEPNGFYNILLQNLEVTQEIIKEINNFDKKNTTGNNV